MIVDIRVWVEWSFYSNLRKYNIKNKCTVDSDAGLVRVGGAKVVTDDALVASLMIEGDVPKVKDGGVLHHSSITGPHMGEVLYLGLT